jgi:hypothetical protein
MTSSSVSARGGARGGSRQPRIITRPLHRPIRLTHSDVMWARGPAPYSPSACAGASSSPHCPAPGTGSSHSCGTSLRGGPRSAHNLLKRPQTPHAGAALTKGREDVVDPVKEEHSQADRPLWCGICTQKTRVFSTRPPPSHSAPYGPRQPSHKPMTVLATSTTGGLEPRDRDPPGVVSPCVALSPTRGGW